MKIHNLFRTFLFGTLALVSDSMWADFRLPNQPVGADGYYIVKWDCENNTWAASNDMEYDETFVLAIDLTGTAYEQWVNKAQIQGGVTYPIDNTIVSLNTFLGARGANMYKDNRARLWHIRDNIYGALYNFAQFEMDNGGTNPTPALGEQTKIYTRIFESATLFSDRCYPIEPTVKKGSVWSYKDNWFCKTDNQPFFVFAPYTGTRTGAAFSTEDMTPGTHIFYDNTHYVVSKGYAAPCSVNDDQCCPFFMPLDPVLQTFPVGSQASLTLKKISGNLAGVHYQWYRYPTASGKTAATTFGTDNATCHPSTDVDGSDYTYYCIVTTDNCPDGVESTEAQVIIQNPCATYTWAIDGVEGLTTPMYPGGWYMVSCTSDAGAPTINITGTNLAMAAATTSGNTTTARVTLQGNATGDIKLIAAASITATTRQCPDTQLIPVGNCENGLAYRMKGFNGGGNCVIDNGGKVVMGTPSGKNDLWQPVATGETFQGYDVVYLRNLGTGQYLYRGPVQLTGGSKGNLQAGNLDYAEPLTSLENAQTDDYKWFFLRTGDQNRYIYVMCKAGWSGNWKTSFALHNRNYAYWYCQGGNNQMCDLRVCSPEMKVGKLDNYDGSNEVRMENDPYNLNNWQFTEVYAAPEHYQTTMAWSGTAPDSVISTQNGQSFTYAATRTDNLHSINTIQYISSNPTAVSVNASGQVKVNNLAAGQVVTITAKLDSVGCFDGAELSYQIMVEQCPTVSGLWPDLVYKQNATPWSMDLEITGDTVGATYQWYSYPYGGSKATATPFNGYQNDGSGKTYQCRPETGLAPGTYTTYYCVVKTPTCTKGVTSPEWRVSIVNYCQTASLTFTLTGTTTYDAGETITLKATLSGGVGGVKQFVWHTPQGDIVDSTSVHPIYSDYYTYSKLTIPNSTAANAGAYSCTVVEIADECERTTTSKTVTVKGEVVCPEWTWQVDGQPGLSAKMYPGGWYMVSCSTPAGAPTITVSGTGVTMDTPTQSGMTTTARVTLLGNATGNITLKAQLTMDTKTCADTQYVAVSECTATGAESRKIEWFNFNGSTPFPQYWIHGGRSVYLRDNKGVLEADTAHTDGNDQWYIVYNGEMCQGQKVFYLQNVQTQRYVYRGATHGNVGGDWEYAEALLSAVNAQTDDYKWVLYAHNGDTAIVNISGFTGGNLTNGAYVLHVRNWEAPSLFANPNIPSPRMVCGKMANQGASPAFYIKGYTTTKPITQFQTTIAWQGTAPADTIISQPGNSFAYTIHRTDTLHSINQTIKYESLDPTIAAVNAATGTVTIVASDGETTIRAILEDVGCFGGDTLSYVVRLYDCTKDIAVHQDHLLPYQPKAEDCSYIVKWDCATGTWATANDMEWGETFVFAVNLHGTALGEWIMKGKRAGVVRSVAFDRFRQRGDEGKQFNLDASRLWHIRDTIYGATFNFSQIPFVSGQSYTPAMGEQTEISARLFGFETAMGIACDQDYSAASGIWWQWSNVGTTLGDWPAGNPWPEDTYVSGNDQYLFRFAPYTGKTDAAIAAKDDDSRDQWYDGHYFTRAGYHSPCPEEWPVDQTLSLDTTSICDEKMETATLTLAASELGYTYQLYQGAAPIGSTQAGTGSALQWTLSEAGTYTIMAISPVAGHDAWMGLCNGSREQQVRVYCEVEEPTYLKFDDKHGTHVWSDEKNWWPKYERLPNDTDSAVIAQPCQVDIPDARTRYLTFTVNAGYDITILPTGGLTITGEMTNAGQGDIYIQSTEAGTGSLVYKPTAKVYPAKVDFYCRAKDGQTETPTWQYIGHPLSGNLSYSSVYTRPNTQIYIWDAQSDHFMGGLWHQVNTAYPFAPFRGYCITQNQPTTYTYEGNLNAATVQKLEVPYLMAEDYPAFYLLSNSWTAPIRIADLQESAFQGVDATIYIMNTGTYQEAKNQQAQQSTTGQAKQKGQYNAIPIHAAPYLQDALQVIPAMQGFFVHNSTADHTAGSVSIDYEKTVYNNAYTLTSESARTPKRRAAAGQVGTLHLSVENIYWADAVDMLQAEHFTPRFDQGWDGSKMHGQNTTLSLSVLTEDGEMAVAALKDWNNVPLSFTGIPGLEYTFKAQVKTDEDWYLYDRQTEVYTLLQDGAEYTFRSSQAVEADRFYIRKGRAYMDEDTTADMDGKYIIEGQLVIIRGGVWYDARGFFSGKWKVESLK